MIPTKQARQNYTSFAAEDTNDVSIHVNQTIENPYNESQPPRIFEPKKPQKRPTHLVPESEPASAFYDEYLTILESDEMQRHEARVNTSTDVEPMPLDSLIIDSSKGPIRKRKTLLKPETLYAGSLSQQSV